MSKYKKPLTAKEIAALDDKGIDFSDIPDVTMLESPMQANMYRPIKKSVTIRLDADVLAWFKGKNPQYQTAINKALREYISDH